MMGLIRRKPVLGRFTPAADSPVTVVAFVTAVAFTIALQRVTTGFRRDSDCSLATFRDS